MTTCPPPRSFHSRTPSKEGGAAIREFEFNPNIIKEGDAGSSNGRTTVFGAVRLGSNPSPAATTCGKRSASTQILFALNPHIAEYLKSLVIRN